MGIFGNLWFGALLARGLPRWAMVLGVAGGMSALHLASGYLDKSSGALWHLLDSTYLGLITWLLLYGGSRADEDLRTSQLAISDEQWASRAPSLGAARLETTMALLVGLALASLSWLVLEVATGGARSTIGQVTIFLRWVIDGAVLIHLGAMILRHRRWLHRFIEADLRVDLLHVDRLSVLSNGFVMWLAVLACLIAVQLSQFTLMRAPDPYELVRMLAGLALGLVVAGLLFTPILWTRNCIIAARERERSLATDGLQGQRIERGDLAIVCEGSYYSMSELLGYLQFLDSIWEWPVRRNLARMGFYALIPPVAWIMSALVEISLSVQLQ